MQDVSWNNWTIIAGCPTKAQTVHLDRHSTVTSVIHWYLIVGFLVPHSGGNISLMQAVLDNENFKLLYDFNAFTDRRILARRPDIVYMDKGSGCTKL